MFFYKNLYTIKKKYIYINTFLINNIFTWHKKNLIWQFFFSGFYFDDIFSKLIKLIFNKLFNISGFFFLDKWFSYWTGVGFFKQILTTFNKIFYFEKVNYFFYLFVLLISISFSFSFLIFILLFFF